MTFWDKYTQPQAPQQPAQPSGPPPPWWAVQQPPVAPVGHQQPTLQQQLGNNLPGQLPIGVLLGQQEYHTDRAQSAKVDTNCPECGSTNYIAPAGHPNHMPQCFECGSNPRFMHSTQGVRSTTTTGSPRNARGQNNTPTALDGAQLGVPELGMPMNSVVGHI